MNKTLKKHGFLVLAAAALAANPILPHAAQADDPDDDAPPISCSAVALAREAVENDGKILSEVPAWFQGSWQAGGQFLDNPPCWHIPAAAQENAGAMLVRIDRAALNNWLIADLLYYDHPGASLYVHLVDTNNDILVANLYGNIMSGGEDVSVIRLALPLPEYPQAAGVLFSRGAGAVTLYEAILYSTEYFEGFDPDAAGRPGAPVFPIVPGGPTPDSEEDADADTPGAPDTTAPRVAVTRPTSQPSFITNALVAAIAGNASDKRGVRRVVWSTDKGFHGECQGTENWSADVRLERGVNFVTISARDAAGNSGMAIIAVTVPPRRPRVTDTAGKVNLKVFTRLE